MLINSLRICHFIFVFFSNFQIRRFLFDFFLFQFFDLTVFQLCWFFLDPMTNRRFHIASFPTAICRKQKLDETRVHFQAPWSIGYYRKPSIITCLQFNAISRDSAMRCCLYRVWEHSRTAKISVKVRAVDSTSAKRHSKFEKSLNHRISI